MKSFAIRSQGSLFTRLPIFGLSLFGLMPGVTPVRAQTLPTGGQVVVGDASIQRSGMGLTIHQATDKAIIDWKDFSIGTGGSVRIENATGATLNRVTGTSASSIDGLLSATGSVYLINRNGIVFGREGRVDVGGSFVASTQDLSNERFLAGGNLTLSGASEAAIINYGRIGAAGGDVALVAAKVVNEGTLAAANGTVGLLAGYQVLLRDRGLENGRFSVVVGGDGTSATNVGAIRAAEAELRAQGGNVYALAGNIGGVINAQGVSTRDGRIFLTAEGGEAHLTGTLRARGADGSGGAVEVTAKNVLLGDKALIDASGTSGGTVLVGGDWQGGADRSLAVADHAIANADAVVMADSAKIDVSGSVGNGGAAVLWSDAYTNFLGHVEAQGAVNGGRVETSSKGVLQALGSVNALGVRGAAGKWLLDPSDITITSGTTNGNFAGTAPLTFTPSGASSTADVGAINSALNAGTSVTISTDSAFAGNGDITLASGTNIAKTSGVADATLQLLANRNIVLNGTVSASGSSTGKLNLTLNSRFKDASDSAQGSIALNGNISLNGGNLLAGGGTTGTGSAINNSGGAGISIGSAAINAAGGNITLIGRTTGASAGISVVSGASIVTSGAGAVSLSGAATATSGTTYGIQFGGSAGAITAGTGGLTLDGRAASASGTALSSTSTAAISSAGALTLTGDKAVALSNALATNGPSGAVSVSTTSGNVSLGALNSVGAITVTSPASLSFGAVTQNGTGAMTFTSANTLTTSAAITKASGADSTLTLRSNANIVVNGAISASAGAGKLNVGLNSRANDGALGSITIANSITTLGGDIAAWGGSAMPNAADPASAGTAKANGDNFGIRIVSAVLDAGGGNIGLAGEQTNTAIGAAGTAAVRIGGDAILKTSGSGVIGIKAVGNANYGAYIFGNLSTTAGAITINGSSAGGAFGGVGVLFAGSASLATDSGAINLTGSATGADTGLMLNSDDAITIKSNTGNMTLTGSATGNSAVEGIAIVGLGGNGGASGSHVIQTGGSITMTANGGKTAFDSTRPNAALRFGRNNQNTNLIIQSGGDLTIKATADTGASALLGYVTSGSTITSGGALSINAGANADKAIAFNNGTITAGSTTEIRSASGAVTLGNFVSNGGAVTIAAAAGSASVGNVTLATSGDTLFSGTSTTFGTITKKASATGASTLTIKSGGDINVNSAITAESGAGKFNVNLNSRATDAVSGAITVNAAITSRGGDVNLYGGSASDKSGGAASSSGVAVTLDSGSAIDASGGNILIRGINTDSNSTNGVSMQGGVQTSGTGTIAVTGQAVGSYIGLVMNSSTLVAGQGNISLTGSTANSSGSRDGSGIRITGGSRTSITTSGDLSLTGTASQYVGIRVDTTATGTILSGKNVSLTGTSTGGANSTSGVLFSNTNSVAITAANKLSITGTGGATDKGGSSRTAIAFGNSSTVANMALTAGAGGVVIDGTGADSNAVFSFDSFPPGGASAAPALSITSAGAVNITGNKVIFYRGSIAQNGGGASTISTSSGNIIVGSYAGTNADALTIQSATGSVETLSTISTTKDLSIRASTTATADAAITSGGALTVQGGTAVSAQAISQTGTSGLVSITSTSGTVATGVIALKTADASNIKAAGTLTTGAITLNGSTALTLDSGVDLTPAAITRKSTSLVDSSLTLLSKGSINLSNAISTEAGANKMDVTIAARSGGAATGVVTITPGITTQGGAILIGGGDSSGSGSTTGIALNANGVLDSRRGSSNGGAITLRAQTSGATQAVNLAAGSSILTSGNAAIGITGDASAGTSRGINVAGATLQSGTGTISLTGKANNAVGIAFDQSSASNISTDGSVVMSGTSTGNLGVWKNGSTALTISGKDVSIEGISKTSGSLTSKNGILLDGTGAVNITGSNSVTLNGTGGASAVSGDYSASAILFGSNVSNTPVTINAGAGGFAMTATADSAATWGVDNYAGGGRKSNVTYNVAGSMNITSNKALLLYGQINQTGTYANSITSSGDGVRIGGNGNTASFDGALTVSGQWVTSGDLALGGVTNMTGGLSASDDGNVTLAAITSKSALSVTALKAITTGTITQPAATNTGDLSLNAGTTITTGAINWATGNMTLASVSDLTPAAITKLANAAGTSTLTIKSDGNVSVANAIGAGSGAGPLNVTLVSRAHDAASGVVAVTGAISTRGGTILLRGGSAATSTVLDPSLSSANYTAFATELQKTGTQISLSNPNLLNAGGGDIELRGASTTTGLNLTSGTLSTTGAGAIRLYGYSSATGSGQGSGVNVNGANVTAGTGGLTVYGTTAQSANSDAVHIENATVTASGGNVLIGGSGNASATGSGNLAGVVLKSATVGFTGSSQSGKVTIGGQAGGGTSGSVGVYIASSSVTSPSSGATTITGTGGNGSGASNYGIYLDQGSTSAPLINTTGSGAVTLDGRVAGGTTVGIYQGPNNGAKIGGGGSGALTLIANALALNNGSGSPALLNTTGALILRPQAGGSFVVDGNILPALIAANAYRANYGSVTFGSSDAASLAFNTTANAKTYASLLTLLSGGTIAIGGSDGLTASGGLTLNAAGAVTQSVDVATSALTGAAGSLALMRASNAITGLGAMAVTGDLSLVTQGALGINGAVTTATGLIRAGGDLSFASTGSVRASGSGTPLNLTTGTKVVNNAGAAALSTPNGRWLLWSQNSTADSLGGLGYGFRQYGAVYGATTPALATGNGVLYTTSPSVTVALTGSYSRDYDGTTDANLAQSNFTVTGLSGSEHATVYSTASFDTKNAGTGKTILADDLAVVVRDGSTKVFGYVLNNFSATGAIGTITPKLLTAGLTGTVSKEYDATDAAALLAANYTLTGVIGSEVVTLVGPTAGRYSDKNAASNKLVTATGLSLTGADAGNYTVANTVSGNVGTITPRALTADLVGSVSKTYDGTALISVASSNVALTGILAGDTVTVANGLSGTFADRNAGTGKTVNVTALTLLGSDAANYTAASTASGAIGTITAKTLTLTAVADAKTYDGTVLSGGAVLASGLVSGDSVAASQSFDSRNAGNRTLQVNDGYVITDGNGGLNYVVTKGAAAAGTIGQRLVSTSLTANDKVYDGTTTATGSFSTLTNKVAGDDLSLDTSAATLAFLDRHAGNGKAVTAAGYALTGADAGNYLLAAIGNGAANITRATLTLNAVTDTKTYDGNTRSTGVVTVAGLMGVDTATGTQAFDTKNAGSRALQVATWTIDDGNNGNNYVVVTHDAAGTIGKKTISGQLTNPISKVYDGTADAILSGASLQGVIAGDAVTVSSASARYADKNTGINKLVTISGMALGGADGGNYVLASTDASGNVGTITARVIDAATTGVGGKTYDGTTTLAHADIGTLALTAAAADTQALMLADGVGFDASGLHGTLTDRNAGTGKVATLTGFTLVNNTANNYVLAGSTAQGVVDVARKALTLNAATDSRVYDGTVNSSAIVQFSGLVAGDTVTATQAFDSKDAGTRSLFVSGYTVSDGNGGANYVVATNTAAGAIAKRIVTTIVNANDKVYDGTTSATGTFGALQNLVSGETADATGTLTFADRNVGTGKAVTVSGATLTGTDARNYALATVADGTAAISKASLVLTAGTDAKTYDGTTASAGAVVATGLATGDTFSATQHFDAKDAGVRRLIVDGGYSVSDGNGGGNYLVTLADAAGRIDKRVVTTAVTVDTRDYDGTTAATGTFGALQNLVTGEVVTVNGGTLAFADRNAGSGKAVTVTGATLGGADAANYILDGVANGTGTVNAKALTLTAVSDSKIYDGTTASGGAVQVAGLVGGDAVIANQVFAGRTAGAHRLQVGQYSVSDGNGGRNYIVTLGNPANGTIDRRVINAAVTINDKVYDGTTTASGTFTGLTGIVSGDVVTVDAASGVLAFLDRNAGNGKAVTVTGATLGGADAGNYTLGSVGSGTANITKATLTLTAAADTKTYDGLRASTGTVTIAGLVGGDTAIATQAFDSKNAGSRTLSADSWTVSDGNDGGNYNVVKVDAAGSIAQKTISSSLTGTVSKVYDGTTTATILPANLSGVIAGDTVTVAATSADYADRNAGTNKLVTVTGMSLTGADALNYQLDQDHTSANIGTITARQIAVGVGGRGAKTYDGTAILSASQLGTLSFVLADGDTTTQSLLTSDGVAIDLAAVSGAFADRNASTGKGVTLTGYALTNNASGNYALANASVQGLADIAKATLTLTAATDTKTYDGLRTSAGTVTIAGLVSGDTATATQAFDSKNAGNRTLLVSDWTLSDGNDGGNYNVVKVDAAGSIAQKTISSSLTGTVSKVYDGTTTATILPANLSGVIAGDAVTVAATSADYADRNAGTNKLVTVTGMSLTGADALNYQLDQDHTSANIGTITARQIAVGVGGRGAKTYDGTAVLSASQLGTLSFVLADGDTTTQSLLTSDGVAIDLAAVSGAFADRNASTGKGVTLTGYTLTNNALGNYALANASVQGLADIAKATLTLTAATDTKTYDGLRTSAGTVTIAGLVSGDTATATQAFDSKNAGNRTLAVSEWTLSDGNDGGNYNVVRVDAAGSIARKTISSSLTGTVSKVYDGTTTATILPANLSGVIAGDTVTVAAASAEYSDRNVGTNKLITVGGMTLQGADAANYLLDSDHAAANVGEIVARQVAVTAGGRGAKTYDGTTNLTASQLGSMTFTLADGDAVTSALLRSDGVSLDASSVNGALADRNAGTGKSAALAGFALVNNASGNYVLVAAPVQGVVDVARQTLTLTAAADTKVYDGTTASTGTVGFSGLITGDTLTATQVFDSKNAGARALKVGEWSIADGNDGGNYAVVKVDAVGTIDRRTVTSSVSANDKTYDGSAVATGTFGTIANMVAGDALTVTADLAFADRNAGVDKAVTVTNARLEGTAASNYTLDPITVTRDKATINRASLVLTAGSDRKTYDGTLDSAGTVSYSGLIAGDTLTATQAFDAKDAGARTLQVSSWTINDGNGGNNYLVSRGATTAGIIDRKALTADFTVNSKTYDGTTAATGTFTGFNGLITGDMVSVDGSAATLIFADRNAGVNKTVFASGITLTGDAAHNYTIASLASGTGTILAKALTLSAVADRKTYDRTTASAGRVTATGLVAGDDVIATQSFAAATAGTHDLQVDGNWRVVDGNNGGNYVVSLDQPAQGVIDKRTIGAAVTVANKIYDGTTTATGTVDGLDGVIMGDVVTVDSSQAVLAFADRNAGTGKTVTATGATLSGQDAGNYKLGTVASGTADIGRATLTLTAASDTRTYDGTTASTGTVTAAGLVVGDTIIGMTQAFDTKNAGSRTLRVQDGYTLTDGNGGGNYTIVKVDAAGTIDRKRLSGALVGTVSKVYDGTTTAALAGANLTGVIAGDRVDVTSATATYADKNAGTSKLVTVTGMTLGGTDAANYVLDQDHASAAVGEIIARRIILSATGTGSKVYDGTVTLTHAGLGTLAVQATDADTRTLMSADGVTFDDAGVSGVFADRHAGTSKVVTLSGYALAGNALGNYVLDTGTAQGVADVARKALTLTAGTDSKTYDGSNLSAALVAIDGLVAGDSAVASQRFDGKDAGTRTLVVHDWTVSDGNGGGDYAVTTVNTAGTITRRVVTSAVHADDKVYDGTTAATGSFGTLTNVVAGETLGVTGVLAFADRNAGANKTVTVSGATLTGSDARNYELSPLGDGTATISKASLVLNASTDRKTYDGTLVSNGAIRATGLVAGDSVTASQLFDGKNAGARILHVVDGSWVVSDGNGGNNYAVSIGDTAVGAITQRVLTTGVVVDTREYDGTTAATGTFGALQNVVLGDQVTLTGGTLAFADRNAGTGKAVTVTGATLGGSDAANYVLADVASGTGTVTRKALVLTAVGDSKVYDGTLASSGQVRASGLVTGDAVIATQAFDGKDVGTRGLQVATWSIADGNGGGNYAVSIDNPVSGTITARTLRAAAVVDDKIYDGTIAAIGRITGLTGVLGSDDVTVGGSGLFTFVDRNVGAGKAVNVSGLTLGGAQAGNYVLDAVSGGSASITKATLTLTASNDSKTYDGTTASSGTVTATGLVVGDTISGMTQAFDTKNAGQRIISANSWTIADGNDGGNYAIVKVDASGTIARKVIDGTLTGTVSKVYDGTTAATLLGANLAGVIAGDAVDVLTSAAYYTGKDVGTGKTVTVTGMALSGRDAGNYDLTSTTASAAVGTITARSVTITAAGRGAKTYDGTDILTTGQRGTLTLSAGDDDALTRSLLASDGVTLDASGVTGTLVDRNAGTGKSVTLGGYALSGNGLGNFVLASNTVLGIADVARASLTLAASDDAKTYDGTTASSGTVRITGLVTGDTATATQVFDSRNAGNRLLKVVDQVINDGNDGGNYVVHLVDGIGTIARRLVTTNAIADDKVYDGTTAATGRYAALTNVLAGDAVGIGAGTMAFADRNAGIGKTVTVTGTTLNGADASNYVLDTIADTTADIGRAALILNASSDMRAYDGTANSAALVQASGLVAGDSVTAVQAFDGKNAGARVLHVVDGSWTVTDGNGGANYIVSIGGTANGAILQRLLTTAVTVNNKEYDGTTAATGAFGGLFNLVGSDQVTLSGGTLAFADRNAGIGKAVTVTGATLSGADAANYALDSIAVGTATITPRALSLQAVADNRIYDGTTVSAAAVLAAGLVGGDTVNATQRFDSRHAGSRLLQVADGWTINDGNGGGNYVVSKGAAVAGTIDRRLVSAGVTVQDKVYDGTTVAIGTIGGLTNVIAGDDLVLDATGGALRFLDRNAGVGKAVSLSGLVLGGSDAADYVLSDLGAGSATIAKATLTLTASADHKTYDGTRTSNGTVTINGLVAGDTATATQAFDTKAAGLRTIGADSWTIADGNDGGNYQIVKVNASGVIDRKLLSGALTGPVTKVYDGTDVATVTPINLDGFVAGDAVTLATDGARYADRNVGSGKTVTVTGMRLTGDDAANYMLGSDQASANIGTITARQVSVNVTGRGAKTYDGTVILRSDQAGGLSFAAAANDAATRALLAADGVTLDASGVTGTLADRNAGTGKSVTLGGYTLSGNGLGNFELASDTVLGIADVARASLTLAASDNTKTYDGTTASAGTVTITGLVAGDSATATQAFDSRNAGNRVLKVVDQVINDGNDGGNYIVHLVDAAGTIARRLVTTGITVDNKVYDGTTAATGTFGRLFNLVGSDQVTLSGGTLAFADRNAGIDKAVTVTGATLSGADAANYALDSIAVGTATITPRALNLQAVADSRIYDGTTVSAAAVLASGLVGGDTVNATQRFDSRHAGSRLLQVADGWTINDGNGGGNYVVSKGAAVAGTIDRRVVSAGFTVQDKVYDGTTVATGTIGGLTNVIVGDDLVLDATGGALRFLDRNAGVGKAVSLSGLVLGGSDAADYVLSDLGAGSATIAKATLTLAASADRKTYDGTRLSSGKVTINGLVAGDTVAASQVFDDRNAGERLLKVTGYTLADGNNGGNYVVRLVDAAGSIDRRTLALTLADATKVKGQADPAFNYAVSSGSLVTGDQINGSPVRDSGEEAGSYAIRAGSLRVNDNYALSVTDGRLTITTVPGGITPVIIQNARSLANRAFASLPGTTETRNLPHQWTGLFENTSGFGWIGKEQLPGNLTVVMQFANEEQGTAEEAGRLGGTEGSNGQDPLNSCLNGSSRTNCGPALGSGFPYPTNSAVTTTIRFVEPSR